MAEPLFVEQIHLMAPPGFQDSVREAARQEGQTVSEFIRQAVKVQLRRVEPEQVAAAPATVIRAMRGLPEHNQPGALDQIAGETLAEAA